MVCVCCGIFLFVQGMACGSSRLYSARCVGAGRDDGVAFQTNISTLLTTHPFWHVVHDLAFFEAAAQVWGGRPHATSAATRTRAACCRRPVSWLLQAALCCGCFLSAIFSVGS